MEENAGYFNKWRIPEKHISINYNPLREQDQLSLAILTMENPSSIHSSGLSLEKIY